MIHLPGEVVPLVFSPAMEGGTAHGLPFFFVFIPSSREIAGASSVIQAPMAISPNPAARRIKHLWRHASIWPIIAILRHLDSKMMSMSTLMLRCLRIEIWRSFLLARETTSREQKEKLGYRPLPPSQFLARPDKAEEVGALFVKSIELAGKHFGFACPTTGEYKIGPDWSHTH
jgi:hypothetical protein